MSSAAQKDTSSTGVQPGLTYWFVARGSVLKGPYTTTQLDEKLKKREVAHVDFCWRQGFREWRPISSVQEFDRRKELKALPTYPSIPVPGGESDGVLGLPASVKLQVIRRQQRQGDKHVAFVSNVRRKSISIYEWGAAICFALLLSLGSVWLALDIVKGQFLQKWTLLSIGTPKVISSVVSDVDLVGLSALPAWSVNPILSAPAFTETIRPTPSGALPNPWTNIPVSIKGIPTFSGSKVLVGGFEIRSPEPLELMQTQDLGLDPMYTQEVHATGYFSSQPGKKIFIQSAGNPVFNP